MISLNFYISVKEGDGIKTVRELAQEIGKSPVRVKAVINELGLNKTYIPNLGSRSVVAISDDDSLKVKAYFNRVSYAKQVMNTKRKFSPSVREDLYPGEIWTNWRFV